MATGIPTAHSYSFYKPYFSSEQDYIWPDEDGTVRGLAIEPLYKNVVKAVKVDEDLHKLLASIDIIRVGKTRETKLALKELQKMIL